ncbi:unnamed protein product, partial [Citrullus colocynthis]
QQRLRNRRQNRADGRIACDWCEQNLAARYGGEDDGSTSNNLARRPAAALDRGREAAERARECRERERDCRG